ncbi:vomeronasal type-1 receptor 43-like [Mirounga leonina]|uniref:vomeronasal type-1 receptor 43-like n=1 Tax=Mirounga leonina TaxID=9715 RepID=UPI00156BF568|nr:vomeronasal type-1 receptor 43-like [Mirounga leonina]
MFLMIIKGTLFLSVIGPGMVGNVFVFVNYTCIFFGDTKKKSVHLILMHLAFTNIIILFSKVTLRTIETSGLRNFPDDTGCTVFASLERVARGLSTCTSSFLTVVQATTSSPGASVCTSFKPASTGRILPFFLFFRMLSSWLGMNLLYHVKNGSSLSRSQSDESEGYCVFLPASQTTTWLFSFPWPCEISCFWVSWAGQGLHGARSPKHPKHAGHLQKPEVLYHNPPEMRAAHSVLLPGSGNSQFADWCDPEEKNSKIGSTVISFYSLDAETGFEGLEIPSKEFSVYDAGNV